MARQTEHTARPWEAKSCDIIAGGRLIAITAVVPLEGNDELAQARTDARYIVTAVNSHADLLAALEGLVFEESIHIPDHLWAQARKAIAKATE